MCWLFSRVNSKRTNQRSSFCLCFDCNWEFDGIFSSFSDHDLCLTVTGEYLSPGHCRNGLCNFSPVTRSPCECDKAFVRCLRKAKTRVANALGRVFFNVAGLTCYKFDYPIKVIKSKEKKIVGFFCRENSKVWSFYGLSFFVIFPLSKSWQSIYPPARPTSPAATVVQLILCNTQCTTSTAWLGMNELVLLH